MPVINFQSPIYKSSRYRCKSYHSVVLHVNSMALKRKRSDSEVSPSSSSTATFPSRDPSSSPCPDIYMLDDAPFAEQPVYRPEILSSHLNSRTRKRFRDSRPDESKIHGTHISCLAFETLLLPLHPLSLTWFSVSNNISKAFLRCTISSFHWTFPTIPKHPQPHIDTTATIFSSQLLAYTLFNPYRL